VTVRTAVIPAAGLGTRFLPATKAMPKEMLPIVDKPAIQYVVEEAVRAGIDDIVIVTSRSKPTLEDHFDRALELEAELERKGKLDLLDEVRGIAELAQLTYVRQSEPLGLGHAVAQAREHVGDRSFAVMLPDDLIHHSVLLLEDMIAAHERMGTSVISLLEVDDPSAYGCAVVEDVAGQSNVVRVLGVVEKPPRDEVPSNLAIMGRYVFTPDVFDAIDRVKPGSGGEIQLTDAIGLLCEEQGVHGFTFTRGRFDAGNKVDYLRAVVEHAIERDDVGPPLRAWLAELCRREGLV
jgi:UTP--glucose-1-phosphate uridylyltransferase